MNKPLTTDGRTRAALRGYSIVPLMTPFTASWGLDAPAVDRLVDHILAGGTQALLVAGTTGEFASISVEMRVRLLKQVAARLRGRAMLFAGIGDTSFDHSVELAKAALALGAGALVANIPSYFPLTPTMMEAYFARLAEAAGGPLYLYNIPQTTRQSIPLDVVERLSHHPRIAGIKDSEPDAARQETLARMFAGRPDFAVFCGSVAMASRAMRAGADGFVPGGGNFVPAAMRELMDLLVANDARADAAQARIDAINAVYQKGRMITQVFSALKGILELHGLCERHVLPPLLPATDAEVAEIRAQLVQLGVLS